MRWTKAERRRKSLRSLAQHLHSDNRYYKRAVFRHTTDTRQQQVRLGSRLFEIIIDRRIYRTSF